MTGDDGEVAGAPGDAGYRSEAYVEPTGPDPAGIPDPMPDDLTVEGTPADDEHPGTDQMGGEAPTG